MNKVSKEDEVDAWIEMKQAYTAQSEATWDEGEVVRNQFAYRELSHSF
jgi:hypothetical protein